MSRHHDKINPRTIRRILAAVFEMYRGRCRRCNIPVGIVRELVPLGWTHYQRDGFLVSPDGDVLAVATVEHIIPLSRGGMIGGRNVTLYCYECNQVVAGNL